LLFSLFLPFLDLLLKKLKVTSIISLFSTKFNPYTCIVFGLLVSFVLFYYNML